MQSADGQWTRSKSFDTFGPLGPCLLMVSEMPPETVVRTTLNGHTVQESPISQMIFSIPRLIAHISRFAALEQGDVISTGTPEGVGPLKIGDLIEVEIDGIGKLRNICAE